MLGAFSQGMVERTAEVKHRSRTVLQSWVDALVDALSDTSTLTPLVDPTLVSV